MDREYDIRTYTNSEGLPPLLEGSFFHGLELFRISARVTGDTPLMAVAIDGEGNVAGQLLAVVHRHHIWFPPFIYKHAHAHGEGIYREEADAERIFPLLLRAITQALRNQHCLYIEFSEIEKKMFGYRHFRNEGYFPVAWQEISNSLHSKTPEERLTAKARKRIDAGEKKGVECHISADVQETWLFHKLYKSFYRMKPHNYVPSKEYFEEISQSCGARLLVCTKATKMLGGCTLAFCNGDAYLWHLAARRKSYLPLHPDTVTVWQAIRYAYGTGCRHIHFMDIGLPWKRNSFRNFIRSFGGKPVTKFRWFRFSNPFVNKLLKWVYKQ